MSQEENSDHSNEELRRVREHIEKIFEQEKFSSADISCVLSKILIAMYQDEGFSKNAFLNIFDISWDVRKFFLKKEGAKK